MGGFFLSSSAYKVLERFLEFYSKDPKKSTVAFIPTAGNVYEETPFIQADRDMLEQLGFQIIDIDIAKEDEESLTKKLDDVDIIFVAGGNTFYLLQQAQRSGFLDIVKEQVKNGTYYIGSSAGSVIAGRSIEHIKTHDDPNLAANIKTCDGLGFIDKKIMPHSDNLKYEQRIQNFLRESGSNLSDFIFIKDNEAIAGNMESYEIIRN